MYISRFSLHPFTWACLDYYFFSTCNMRQSCSVHPPPIFSSPTPVCLEPPSYLSPCPCFLYALRTQVVSTELGGVGGQRGDWGPGSGGGRKGEGWVRVELVGRSGAAPPVIIRVTAARARLCAACTRRDVLPREKSEHLSVPPRRQQPPTSLSNSTQLVTRSPNSYFLSLTHSRTPTLNYSALLFLFRSLPPLQTAPLTRSLFRTGCESSRPLVSADCRKRVHVIFGLKWILCERNANAHSTTEQLFLFKLLRLFIRYLRPMLIA